MREAITLANTAGGTNQIDFDGDYTVVLATSLPTITSDITITGHGWDKTIIDGGNPPGGTSGVRILRVGSSAALTLDGVCLQNGFVGPFDFNGGGAVFVEDGGSFSFLNCRCERNTAPYGG